ncbi:MAG: SH3 domain-containing protein, partial [Gammaproteobacteria bacterium]
MTRMLAAGPWLCAMVIVSAAQAASPVRMDGLLAFAETIPAGEARAPRRYFEQLPAITSRNGKRTVEPTLDLTAGRLDAHDCLYQLRLELRWSGTAAHEDDAEVSGRSLIQKAPCATLAQEIVAVAVYEISALERRLRDGGRFASNSERELVIAAARRAPLANAGAQTLLAAVTVDSRVNLRVSPSLKAPVLAKLVPASLVHVVATASPDWYQLQGQPGYVHASALQSVHPAEILAPPEPLIEPVGGGTAHPALEEPRGIK